MEAEAEQSIIFSRWSKPQHRTIIEHTPREIAQEKEEKRLMPNL